MAKIGPNRQRGRGRIQRSRIGESGRVAPCMQVGPKMGRPISRGIAGPHGRVPPSGDTLGLGLDVSCLDAGLAVERITRVTSHIDTRQHYCICLGAVKRWHVLAAGPSISR